MGKEKIKPRGEIYRYKETKFGPKKKEKKDRGGR